MIILKIALPRGKQIAAEKLSLLIHLEVSFNFQTVSEI